MDRLHRIQRSLSGARAGARAEARAEAHTSHIHADEQNLKPGWVFLGVGFSPHRKHVESRLRK